MSECFNSSGLTSDQVPGAWRVLYIKDLTRNPETEKYPVWNLKNIWGLK